MFAVIATGGKQYRVQEGDVIFVEKLSAMSDETVKFDVLVAGDGETTKVGTPIVEGAVCEGVVKGAGKKAKVIIFKYKSKKNSRNTKGHRQPFTKVEITKITM